MKLCFEVPDTFMACGVTLIYDDGARGYAMYSSSVTADEVAGEKVLVLPREGTKNESDA